MPLSVRPKKKNQNDTKMNRLIELTSTHIPIQSYGGVPAPTGALHYPLDVHLASLPLTDIWGVANSALQTLLK